VNVEADIERSERVSPVRPSWRQAQTLALKQAIQAAALRLFAERGYAETTVGMIADEVGIAERTCYRHFPAKPDLVLFDAADYDLLARFRERPAAEGVITAFRETLHAGYATLTDEQRDLEQRRNQLILAVPEVRAAHLDHFAAGAVGFAAAVAERTGRESHDPEIVAVSGAIIGIMMTAPLTTPAGNAGLIGTIDEALMRLQDGFRTL
jgi:AcrR family transcriptional regulator